MLPLQLGASLLHHGYMNEYHLIKREISEYIYLHHHVSNEQIHYFEIYIPPLTPLYLLSFINNLQVK